VPQDLSPADPTLTKLLEIDAELTSQEAGLLAQLQTLQEKRKSLQIVLGLFAPKEQAAPPDTTSTPAPSNGQAEPVVATPEAAPIAEAAPPPQIEESESPEPVKAPATRSQEGASAPRQRPSTSTKQSAKAQKQRSQGKQKALAKTGGRGEVWRPYVREEFTETAPLAEMASTVMQRFPERVFTAPEILRAIFTEDIPQSQYDTAKGRLFTVLSNGVKENLWVRHDKGQYSAPA
jgi:hypothetical protein